MYYKVQKRTMNTVVSTSKITPIKVWAVEITSDDISRTSMLISKKMESELLLGGLESTTQRGSAELSRGVSYLLCVWGGSNPLTPAANTALFAITTL